MVAMIGFDALTALLAGAPDLPDDRWAALDRLTLHLAGRLPVGCTVRRDVIVPVSGHVDLLVDGRWVVVLGADLLGCELVGLLMSHHVAGVVVAFDRQWFARGDASRQVDMVRGMQARQPGRVTLVQTGGVA